MASTNMTVSVTLKMPVWRMRLARVLIRMRLADLAVWVVDGAPIHGRIGNRDDQVLGRITASRLGVSFHPKRLMGSDLPPKEPGTVALEDVDDR